MASARRGDQGGAGTPGDGPRESGRGASVLGASMDLLAQVMSHPVDPSYQQAAQQRGRHHRATLFERSILLVLAIVVGLGVSAAVLWLRAPEPSAAHARTLLEQQIAEARANITSVKSHNRELRSQLDRLQSAALGAKTPQLVLDAELDVTRAAQIPVHGPGLVVTLRDGSRGDQDEEARVQDSDVQMVVNTLWSLGAEAIAVNGNRLGPGSAIRSAGSAILVDLVGLSSPYQIAAIGQPDQLNEAFSRSRTAKRLDELDAGYGIRHSTARSSLLNLPAAPVEHLHEARSPKSLRSAMTSATSSSRAAFTGGAREGAS